MHNNSALHCLQMCFFFSQFGRIISVTTDVCINTCVSEAEREKEGVRGLWIIIMLQQEDCGLHAGTVY